MNLIQADQELITHKIRKLEDLNIATRMNDGRIQTEERIAGNKQREAVQPEIDRLGNIFGKAFLATRDAHLAYHTFINRLEDAGGNVSMLRISPAGLVNPSERNSPYAYGLRELSEAGFLTDIDVAKVF